MYWKLFKNDMKNNIFQTVNLAFFIVLSVAFFAMAGQLTLHLTTSVRQLFEQSKIPHLLQMHTGEIDRLRMEAFVDTHPQIEAYQILDLLNIDNSMLAISGNSLKDSVYDNGFSIQSPKFDYLLDLSDDIIKVREGEVYVPIFYHTAGLAKTGDFLTLGDYSFEITGFVRDAQMNSSLSVSKRFLLHPNDYERIRPLGTLEHLIEFRLRDLRQSAKIETAYTKAQLEANGPPMITYPLFKLVNAFSDGITIVALLLISFLTIGIAFLCIRFSILAQLEEEYRELAVLRAIGLPIRDIRRIFLGKYLFISAIAAFVGFVLSFSLKIPLLQNMKMFFGETKNTLSITLTAFLLSLLVFFLIVFYMRHLGKNLEHLSLHRAPSDEEEGVLRSHAALPQFLHLAFSDLLARRKVYWTMGMVFVLSVFILTLPLSIYSTISDKNFVSYLGLGVYDVRVDLSQMEHKEESIRKLISKLREDPAMNKMDVITAKFVDYRTDTGDIQKIWMELGDPDMFPIHYITGEAPAKKDEIALSKLQADELSKKVGDRLDFILDGKEIPLTVSGIFSDLTNGGKTAKAHFQSSHSDPVWMILPIQLKKDADVSDFIRRFQSDYPFAKFADTKTYLHQIFGNTIAMVGRISQIAFIAALVLIFLITVLFTRMLYFKDQSQHALLRSFGFTNKTLRYQYFIKIGSILAGALLIGYLLSLTAGDLLGSAILSMIGVHGVRFVRDPFFAYLITPLALFTAVLFAVRFGVSGLKHMNIAQLLKEDLSL